jgi:hypothetical protein
MSVISQETYVTADLTAAALTGHESTLPIMHASMTTA